MKNINLFGGPGTGKSTTAAGVFHEMKKDGKKIEYISEYAKDLVFSRDFYKIKDQVMILAKQSHPWFKLEDQVDFTVNDGPFLLGLIYLQHSVHIPEEELKQLIVKMYKSWDNINIFIQRSDYHEYQEYGRTQTFEEAKVIDEEILAMLKDTGVEFMTVTNGPNVVKEILDIVENLS